MGTPFTGTIGTDINSLIKRDDNAPLDTNLHKVGSGDGSDSPLYLATDKIGFNEAVDMEKTSTQINATVDFKEAITASPTELNILDGATVSTAELNHVDGVTSPIQTQLDGKEATANKGAANGYAPLGSDSKISSTYLPSYVDDVLEYANLAAFPGTGSTGVLYVAIDTGYQYRWSGSTYVEIKDSGETAASAGALINSATDKATPVDADYFGIMDSAASNILKKLSWANVKDTLLTTWAGSSNITTLGTIATGTWNATAIGYTKGGTGLTALGSALQVLRTNAGGTAMEWATVSGGSASLSGLTAATATNTIDNTLYAQTWNWSTLTTETGLLMTADGATSGSVLKITSNTSTTGLSGMCGVNVQLSGSNSGASRTSYAGYFSNVRTGTTSNSYALYATTSGASFATDLPLVAIGHSGGGLKFGNANSTTGTIWANAVTNLTSGTAALIADAFGTTINCSSGNVVYLSINNSSLMRINSSGVAVGSGSGNPFNQFSVPVAPTGTANYGLASFGSGTWAGAAGGFSGSSSGTVLAVNAASGFAGGMINTQIAGVQNFKVTNTGATSIGISGTNWSNNASALLQLESTTQGFRPPVMTSTQASAIGTPDKIIVFVTDTNGTFTSVGFWGYNGSAWVQLG
jgi:hypothetical protein